LKATFVELPAFERLRPDYLSDEEFAVLQQSRMARPDAGDVMPGAGGLRKFSDLTAVQRRAFKKVLEAELEARRLDG